MVVPPSMALASARLKRRLKVAGSSSKKNQSVVGKGLKTAQSMAENVAPKVFPGRLLRHTCGRPFEAIGGAIERLDASAHDRAAADLCHTGRGRRAVWDADGHTKMRAPQRLPISWT